MYTEKDFETVARQARLRLIGLIALGAAFLAIILVVNHQRLEYLTMALGGVGFIAVYFVASFKVAPWIRYNRFLREMKAGRKRTLACTFHGFSPELRTHDGVEVYDMNVSVGEGEEDQRLYYWDADKAQPTLEEGQQVIVESFGNFVVSVETA